LFPHTHTHTHTHTHLKHVEVITGKTEMRCIFLKCSVLLEVILHNTVGSE